MNYYRKIMVIILAILSAGFITHGESVMIQKDEVKLDAAQAKSFTFRVPSEWQNCFLKVDARMEYPSKQRIGSHYAFHAAFNGHNLDSRRLVNYPNPLYFRTVSGNGLYIYSKPHEMYRTFYSPDFKKYPVGSQLNNPDFAPEYPYTYAFDVSDLVKKDDENTVSFKNKVRHFQFPIFCQDIELLPDYRKIPDYSGADTSRIKGYVVPKKNYMVAYKLETGRNGGMRLTVNGDIYELDSAFSYPEGELNCFAERPGKSEWKVDILENNIQNVVLKGAGKYYSVIRTVRLLPDRLSVSDEIMNLTGTDLGIICKRNINGREIKEVRLAGYVLPVLTGNFGEQVRAGENPTIYVQQNNSGVGFFAMDDVFRANVSMDAEKGGPYVLQNRKLVLAPGKSYTAVFDVYPTATPDYFAFVNSARRALEVNFKIDGNLTFAHSFEDETAKLPQKKFRDLVRFNNPTYIGINSMTKVDENGKLCSKNKLSSFVWGSLTLLDDDNKYTREALLEVKKRFLKENPKLKFVVYHDAFLGALSEPEKMYSDSSLWYDAHNKLVKYTSLKGSRMAPRTDNGWGRDLQKVYAFFRDNGFGIFWDESTAEPYFAYNDWDGYTGNINLKTFKLEKKIRNIALDSLKFRLALLDFCEKNNMPVWCNFMPVTTTMSKRKVYRFVEGHDSLSAIRSHFYTPISWGNPHTEVSEEDITDSMKNKLANGGMYMYYSTKFTSDNNFMQKLYPFTPLELHPGYIIGQEKILTMRSGNFGWGDQSAVKGEIYDKTGHLTSKTVSVKNNPGYGNCADLNLQDGEFALIYRN